MREAASIQTALPDEWVRRLHIQLLDCTGYQAWPFSIDKAMNAVAK